MTDHDIAIHASKLTKSYRLGQGLAHDTLRDVLAEGLRSPGKWFRPRRQRAPSHPVIHALEDVSFSVPRGQIVGLIGSNGAGKSTILRILSRITKPTRGFVDINGRVGSLLDVGTGFHNELTGRENIYLNGAILGMTRAEIRSRFEEIVEFSGVAQFLDTPVKRYSSGME
ncbi:MAG: ABC transporter ATP-binding protein, partial [Gemmatimonadales bacterium]|nr:ABC transporter ATP-binding protein [Gemmatimonadales bacterium]